MRGVLVSGSQLRTVEGDSSVWSRSTNSMMTVSGEVTGPPAPSPRVARARARRPARPHARRVGTVVGTTLYTRRVAPYVRARGPS